MFWVMTQSSRPSRSSSAIASCAALGRASLNRLPFVKNRHCLFRASGLARNRSIVKSSGSIFVQMPPGLRKSGIPDSVLTPAPVNTTTRFAFTIIAAIRTIPCCGSCSTISFLRAARTIDEVPGKNKTKTRDFPLPLPIFHEAAGSCRKPENESFPSRRPSAEGRIVFVHKMLEYLENIR